MEDTLSAGQLIELIEDGADITTTVYSFRDAEIRRFVNGELCLLEISGMYSPSLAKEIEKLVATWRGDLGLTFTGIKVNPKRKRKFDPSIIAVLRKTLTRLKRNRKSFTLCSPPTELVDMLKLTGTLDQFEIVDRDGDSSGSRPSHIKRPEAPNLPSESKAIAPGQKKMRLLNQSLQRTVKLEKGLDSAAKYIKQFLPSKPPKAEGFEFAFLYESSEKVGGDFFDFISLGDGKLGICVGDVAGHDMDAALLMGITKKVIRIRAVDDTSNSPRSVLCKASKDVSEDFSPASFVTVLYGILDTTNGMFTFTRAGHEHPIIIGPEPASMETITSKGMPLGMDKLIKLEPALDETTIQLAEGACLLLCTDGLPEARSEKGVLYSRDRLDFDLKGVSADTSCQEILELISRSLDDFTGGAPQEDDITVVLVKRNRNTSASGRNVRAAPCVSATRSTNSHDF